jgi:hypothetical protein
MLPERDPELDPELDMDEGLLRRELLTIQLAVMLSR